MSTQLTLKEKREQRALEERQKLGLIDTIEIVKQIDPIDVPIKTVHETEWVGMPEFYQEDTTSFQAIKIHFRNVNDRLEFEKLIDQKFTNKTQSAWYPKMITERPSTFLYLDKNN